MAIMRSDISQQINKPGVKKKSLYSKAKDKIKKLDISKKMPDSLKKNTIRKGLSKAARFGLKTAMYANPLGQAIGVYDIGKMAFDEYKKPESVANRKKIAKETKERKEKFKISQAKKRKNNICNKQDKIQFAKVEKENEKVIKKYMGGTLNKRSK